MPLPQQVISQLSRGEPAATPGWSSGVLIFSGSILAVTLVIYLGISFIYVPQLNGQISSLQGQISQLGQSISSSDQAKLVTFYSQASNLKSLLQHHIVFSHFFTWLEANTEANVYYSQFSFASGNQITILANALSQGDVTQQIAIFEASPELQRVVVSNINQPVANGPIQFNVALSLKPGVIMLPPVSSSSTVSSSTSL